MPLSEHFRIHPRTAPQTTESSSCVIQDLPFSSSLHFVCLFFPNSWKLGVFSHRKGFGAGWGALPQDSFRFPTGFPTGFPTVFLNRGSQTGFPTVFPTGFPTGFSTRVPKQGSQHGFNRVPKQGSQTVFPNKVHNRVPSRVPNTVCQQGS